MSTVLSIFIAGNSSLDFVLSGIVKSGIISFPSSSSKPAGAKNNVGLKIIRDFDPVDFNGHMGDA